MNTDLLLKIIFCLSFNVSSIKIEFGYLLVELVHNNDVQEWVCERTLFLIRGINFYLLES